MTTREAATPIGLAVIGCGSIGRIRAVLAANHPSVPERAWRSPPLAKPTLCMATRGSPASGIRRGRVYFLGNSPALEWAVHGIRTNGIAPRRVGTPLAYRVEARRRVRLRRRCPFVHVIKPALVAGGI